MIDTRIPLSAVPHIPLKNCSFFHVSHPMSCRTLSDASEVKFPNQGKAVARPLGNGCTVDFVVDVEEAFGEIVSPFGKCCPNMTAVWLALYSTEKSTATPLHLVVSPMSICIGTINKDYLSDRNFKIQSLIKSIPLRL